MNDNISEIPYEGEIVEYMLRRYDVIFVRSQDEKLYKTIIVYNNQKMLTQALDPYQIDDVSKDHGCKIPEYFAILDSRVKFDVSGVRNINFWTTINIEIRCSNYLSTNEKMFIVEICGDRRVSSSLRNIISQKIISKECEFFYRIQFSVNPYNKRWHFVDPLELLYTLFDPSTGYARMETHTMELKRFKMKIYTDTPIHELNTKRKMRMEFQNVLPDPIEDVDFKFFVECGKYLYRKLHFLNAFQRYILFFNTDSNVSLNDS
ncbi:hypothetical protein RF11_13133 [Thelohanellus kitauei]|uniref:Uncharacterized protein n=1 Tax=Thelohanellus kitauei TaxID=669202 RepID=A0A0C2JMF1_THEKT|nr:hypothetical protein RF11_13133 [Thelohanellus kitauei]